MSTEQVNDNALTVESGKKRSGSKVVTQTRGTPSQSSKITSRVNIRETKCPNACSRAGHLEQDKSKYLAFDKSIIKPDKTPIIPHIEEKADKYQPMSYIFRVPDVSTNMKVVNQVTRCPPFYIQLDHAIAVVWALYSKEETEKPLGINQLQWAWAFLNNINDDRGRPSKDVAHCLNSISDELIEQYAELADDVQKIKKRLNRRNEVRFAPVATSSGMDQTAAEADAEKDSVMIELDVPFSINYADMVLHAPKTRIDVCGQPQAAELDRNASRAKANYKKLLNEMHRDQLNKILVEMERLNTIDNHFAENLSLSDENEELHRLILEKLKSYKSA